MEIPTGEPTSLPKATRLRRLMHLSSVLKTDNEKKVISDGYKEVSRPNFNVYVHRKILNKDIFKFFKKKGADDALTDTKIRNSEKIIKKQVEEERNNTTTVLTSALSSFSDEEKNKKEILMLHGGIIEPITIPIVPGLAHFNDIPYPTELNIYSNLEYSNEDKGLNFRVSSSPMYSSSVSITATPPLSSYEYEKPLSLLHKGPLSFNQVKKEGTLGPPSKECLIKNWRSRQELVRAAWIASWDAETDEINCLRNALCAQETGEEAESDKGKVFIIDEAEEGSENELLNITTTFILPSQIERMAPPLLVQKHNEVTEQQQQQHSDDAPAAAADTAGAAGSAAVAAVPQGIFYYILKGAVAVLERSTAAIAACSSPFAVDVSQIVVERGDDENMNFKREILVEDERKKKLNQEKIEKGIQIKEEEGIKREDIYKEKADDQKRNEMNEGNRSVRTPEVAPQWRFFHEANLSSVLSKKYKDEDQFDSFSGNPLLLDYPICSKPNILKKQLSSSSSSLILHDDQQPPHLFRRPVKIAAAALGNTTKAFSSSFSIWEFPFFPFNLKKIKVRDENEEKPKNEKDGLMSTHEIPIRVAQRRLNAAKDGKEHLTISFSSSSSSSFRIASGNFYKQIRNRRLVESKEIEKDTTATAEKLNFLNGSHLLKNYCGEQTNHNKNNTENIISMNEFLHIFKHNEGRIEEKNTEELHCTFYNNDKVEPIKFNKIKNYQIDAILGVPTAPDDEDMDMVDLVVEKKNKNILFKPHNETNDNNFNCIINEKEEDESNNNSNKRRKTNFNEFDKKHVSFDRLSR